MRPVAIGLASGTPQRSVYKGMSVIMKNKIELIYCIMVVTTAVLAGIVKCTAIASCTNCGDFIDP